MCKAVTSIPPAASFVITGATSSTVSTRSPITIPWSPIFSKASQLPSAKPAFSSTVQGDLQIGARQAHAVDASRRCRARLSKSLADLRLPVIGGNGKPRRCSYESYER